MRLVNRKFNILARFIVLIVFAVLATTIICTGCNGDNGEEKTTIRGVHIFGSCTETDVAITSVPFIGTSMVIVNTVEYGQLKISNGRYLLFKNKCPICGTKLEGRKE